MKQKIVLIVAVAAGLVAALLTRTYLSAKDAEIAREKAAFTKAHGVMEVLCYNKNVPGGTVVSADNIGKKSVPAAGLRGQALTENDFQTVAGRKIITSHRRGDILFWSDIEGGNPSAGGLAADIRRSMRAISINASGAAAVSGMIRPNDHVDVIGTFSFPKTAPDGKTIIQELVTCTILQNVLVLATGKDTAKSANRSTLAGTSNYSTVTLEVTPREAEMLVFAEQMKGRLLLTLRNRNDTTYEKELPRVDFNKIQSEIEELNIKRQSGIRK